MRLLRAAAAAFVLAAPASAAFEDVGAGARAPGMGDAFTALADDAFAAHYNPAGLAQLERPEFGAAYSKLYAGLSDGSDLGTSQLFYVHPLARGKQGALGLGWERFSLSGLYTEQALSASYGRRVWGGDDGAQLMAGASAKYLTHSFGSSAEAGAACDQGQCDRGPDPVLSGSRSKSLPDADVGLLYRFPKRFQAGLSVAHLTEPDAGFAGADRLRRAVNLGVAYKSLWLSLIGELKVRPVASGGTARDGVFAAERYFPTLDYGQFGLRGSVGLGLGNSDWRQMTVGASYRVNKIQFDYAFLLPVGAASAGQSGSHRFSLTFHFGAPTSDEELGRDLLAQSKRLRERGPDYGYEYSRELKPQDLGDPRLAEVRRLIDARKYRLAKKTLTDLAERQPLSDPLIRLSNRLDLAAYHYTDLPDTQDRFETALADGLRRFLGGSDRLALLHVSYAVSLRPDDARPARLLEDMEKAVGLKAPRPPEDRSRGFIEELLYQAEFAHTRGDAARSEALLNDVLTLEPANATALERLGSLRYLAGRLPEAIDAWEAAARLETRERELESLREYLRLARARSGAKALPGAAATEPAPSAPAAPPTPAAAEPPPAPPAPAAAPAPAGDPRDVEKLYQLGVEHYARGEFLQASSMFLRVLRIDPGNEPARKALERIERRKARP